MEQTPEEKTRSTPSAFFPCLGSSRKDFLDEARQRESHLGQVLKIVFLLYYAFFFLLCSFSNRYSDPNGTSFFIVFCIIGALLLVASVFIRPQKGGSSLLMIGKGREALLSDEPQPLPASPIAPVSSPVAEVIPVPNQENHSPATALPVEEDHPLLQVLPKETRSLEERAKDLENYFLASGWGISLTEAREILASLAASHLLFVSGLAEDLHYPFFATLASFFAAEPYFQGDTSAWKKPEDSLYFLTADGQPKQTAFLKGLLEAKEQPERFSFLGLEKIVPADFFVSFSPFLPLILFPKEEHSFVLDGESIPLAKGLYFVAFFASETSLQDVPPALLAHACFIQSKAHKEGEAKEVTNEHPFSYEEFAHEVEESKEHSYLSEESWKKLDSFLNYLQKGITYSPDNIRNNQSEDFSSTFLASGGESSECLDALVAGFLLPVSYALDKKALLHLEPDLSSFLGDLLGEEAVPNSESLIHQEAHLESAAKKEGGEA